MVLVLELALALNNFVQLQTEHPQFDRRSCSVKEFFPAEGQTVVIDGEVSVTVLEIRGDEVLLAIDAPAWVEVRQPQRPTSPALPR